jgi:hypothetical protein
MKVFSQYLLLFSICILSSCGIGNKIYVNPHQIIKDDYNNGHIVGLIQDLSAYPFHRNYIESLLFNHIYDNVSYSDLKEFHRISQNDFKACEFFDSLLISRQIHTLDSLSLLSLNQIGDFYYKESREHDYLRKHFEEIYFSNIDSLDYINLRALNKAFGSTDLKNLYFDRYMSLRAEILNESMETLEEYLKIEDELIDDIEGTVREECWLYIENGVTEIIEGLMTKNNRGLFKKIFKREVVDNYQFKEYAEILINEYLSPETVQKTVTDKLDQLISACTEYRQEIYNTYFLDLKVDDLFINSDFHNHKCIWTIGRQDVDNISNIQLTGKALTAGSIALGFVPGIGALAIAADIADFAYSMTQDKQIDNAMLQLTQTLLDDSFKCVDNYINEVFRIVRSSKTYTDNNAKTRLYEEL